jgi:hypothetical protein
MLKSGAELTLLPSDNLFARLMAAGNGIWPASPESK